MTDKNNDSQKQIEIVMHPEATNAYFANSFSIEVAEDDATIGFGQTIPVDSKKIREIRKRIVLTHKGLRVVAKLLDDAIANLDKKSKQN